MSRGLFIAVGIWIAAAALLVAGIAAGFWHHLPNAYVCGWLLLISLPLGALPALMALEAANAGDLAIAAPLRLLLASLPVLALLAAPLLLDLRGAYTWQACLLSHCPSFHYEGFGARWFKREAFVLRSLAYLVVWVALSLYFLRPARPNAARRSLAAFGLAIHLVVGTLAAFDWFMSLDEGYVSSNYGVLVMSVQCAFALLAALLLLPATERGRLERPTILAVLVVVGAAAFAQFAEYLVVWSANLPKEIAWYQGRATGGRAFAIVAPVLLALGIIVQVPERFAAHRAVGTLALGALFMVGFVDLILLASPNGLFVSNLPADLIVIATLGGAAVLCASWLGGRRRAGTPRG